jgi:hypothetical protein
VPRIVVVGALAEAGGAAEGGELALEVLGCRPEPVGRRGRIANVRAVVTGRFEAIVELAGLAGRRLLRAAERLEFGERDERVRVDVGGGHASAQLHVRQRLVEPLKRAAQLARGDEAVAVRVEFAKHLASPRRRVGLLPGRGRAREVEARRSTACRVCSAEHRRARAEGCDEQW